MKTIIILLLLSGLCFAEDFTKDKFTAEELVKEIEMTTGLVLTGKDQQGFMNTCGDKIEIKMKDRELTQEEKQEINSAIIAHIPKTEKQKDAEKEQEKAVRAQKEAALKTKFGWTDDDLNALKEIFGR